MKTVLSAFAKYNRGANAALAALLAGLPESVLREDQGAFYKSLVGTFEHLVSAEVAWLKRYPTFFTLACLEGQALVAADIEATKARIAASPAELFAVSAEADALLEAVAAEVGESRLAGRVKYKNYKGEELERPFWNLLFHLLNHGTHHRGEISALLDRKGVKNDFAGFNSYMG